MDLQPVVDVEIRGRRLLLQAERHDAGRVLDRPLLGVVVGVEQRLRGPVLAGSGRARPDAADLGSLLRSRGRLGTLSGSSAASGAASVVSAVDSTDPAGFLTAPGPGNLAPVRPRGGGGDRQGEQRRPEE